MGSAQTLAQYWHKDLLRSPKGQAVLLPPGAPSIARGGWPGAGAVAERGAGNPSGGSCGGPRRLAPGPGRSDSRSGGGGGAEPARRSLLPGEGGGPCGRFSPPSLSPRGARRGRVRGELVGPPLRRRPGSAIPRGGLRAPCGHPRAAGRVSPPRRSRARAGPRRALLPPPRRRGRAGGLRRPSSAGGTGSGAGGTAALPGEMLPGGNSGVGLRGPASRFWSRHQHLSPCRENQREEAPSSLEPSFPSVSTGKPIADLRLGPSGADEW